MAKRIAPPILPNRGYAFNQLNAGEEERLAIALEEMGEATQIIGKILRHGYESTNRGRMRTTNRRLLEKELGDVLAAIDLLCGPTGHEPHLRPDVHSLALDRHRAAKLKKVRKYLHHQQGRVLQFRAS